MLTSKVRISAVKYANTYPFIYGLTETGFDKKVVLTTDHPADCAKKLISREVDIGLIPVAALPAVKDYHIISDYCLGAYGKVRTVTAFKQLPLRTDTYDQPRLQVTLFGQPRKDTCKEFMEEGVFVEKHLRAF